jgi:hypothetical protein
MLPPIETEFLLGPAEILFVPEVSICLSLPAYQERKPHQIELIKQFVLALKIPLFEVKWQYYSQLEKPFPGILREGLEFPICLIFMDQTEDLPEPVCVKSGDNVSIWIEDPSKIEGNIASKRKVWEALKPFVRA